MTPRRLIEPARLASTAVLRGQSDERLIDLARAGNERAFEAIVHRYRKPLLRYCARILPPGRAEDAVQQAFLSAHNAIANGDKQLKLRPWLYRVAHNSALNLLRQNGWNHEELDDQFDGVLRPDQALEARERIRALVASVKSLPERQRDALVLRELEGRSYEEIAAALGVTDGAVRQLLNRARSTLRAGATAITPYGLLERIADLGTGTGAGLSLAKVGAAVLATGAVATGAANHGVLGLAGSSHRGGDHSSQASATPTHAGSGTARALQLAAKDPASRSDTSRTDGRRQHGGSKRHHHRGDDRSGSSGSGDDGARMVDQHSGDRNSGSGSSGGDHSGSGSGDISSNSGSGSSGDGSSGSGDRMSETTSTSGSSGSGSSGSGSSSGSDGSSTSLDSGSGSSGSGSSSDGGGSGTSGSGDGTTTTSTDGSR
ncbi:MAG: RNA polymerase sigma factor [Thermoleophilaceae bacterium]